MSDRLSTRWVAVSKFSEARINARQSKYSCFKSSAKDRSSPSRGRSSSPSALSAPISVSGFSRLISGTEAAGSSESTPFTALMSGAKKDTPGSSLAKNALSAFSPMEAECISVTRPGRLWASSISSVKRHARSKKRRSFTAGSNT